MRQFFLTIRDVIFKPGKFWSDVSAGGGHGSLDALRSYAVPLVALAQIAKFPIIGVPRTAMIYGIINFILDVAVLYLLMGLYTASLDEARGKDGATSAALIPCFSLTPFWILEPLFLFDRFGLFFAGAGVLCALFVANTAVAVLYPHRLPLPAKVSYRLQLVTALGTMLTFFLMSGVMNIFTL